jgi:hypothetical protein
VGPSTHTYYHDDYTAQAGVLIVTKREMHDDGSCVWKTVRHLKIPSSANFADYSGINVNSEGTVLITSQVSTLTALTQQSTFVNRLLNADCRTAAVRADCPVEVRSCCSSSVLKAVGAVAAVHTSAVCSST